MICEKYKTIFIHIPKNGGTSIEKAFFLENKFKDYGFDEKKEWYLQHLKIDELIKRKFITKENAKRYFKFTFVRNPWENILSHYIYHKKKKVIDCKSFEEFIIELDKLLEGKKSKLKNGKQYKNQTDYFKPQEMNFVGRLENIDEDFDKICKIIGKPRQKLKKYNPTNHLHYSQYYTPLAKKIVDKLYKRDIEQLGYTFKELNIREKTIDLIKYYFRGILNSLYPISFFLRQKSKTYGKIIDSIKKNLYRNENKD